MRHFSRTRIGALALATVLLAAVEPARAWLTDVEPGRALAVAVDGNDDVAAAGRLDGITQDSLVVKLDGIDGTELWRRIVAGGGNGNDVAHSVVVAGNGDVIAAGEAVEVGTDVDALVCRLAAADGTEVWQVTRDGGAGGKDEASDVTLDGNGDVIAVGTNAVPQKQFSVFKLAGTTGAELWSIEVAGGAGAATSVAVDASDNIVAAGRVGALMTIVKLTTGGVESWRTDVAGDPSADDEARAVALNGVHDVVVAGHMTTDAGGQDFAVVSLDATTGAENWRYVIDGAASGEDAAVDVAVDAAGDVIAVGYMSNADESDLIAVKLAGATGAEVWRKTVNGPGAGLDEASAVAVIGGAVVVVGTVQNLASKRDILVLNLDGATGGELWQREIDGGAGKNDLGASVAIDDVGDVVVGARTRDEAGVMRFAALKLAGVSGAEFPCGNGTTEAGEDCDDGNGTLGDGCRPDCTEERCGDGIVDPQEDCDGGGTEPCCSETCAHVPDETPCDDGDACTTSTACDSGVCAGGATVACGVCETCDSTSGCMAKILSGCRVSTKLRTRFILRDRDPDRKDWLRWAWSKGEFTDANDFGDPTTTDSFDLCVFDRSNATPALLSAATVPPGDGWTVKNEKVLFKGKTGASGGIRRAKLRAAPTGRAAASVIGKGENLQMPPLPLSLPVTVQLQAATGKCWEATYAEDDVKKNTPTLFKGMGGSLAVPSIGPVAAGPVGVLSHTGRWLTDETGRVVLLHGTNLVQKTARPPPNESFDADDAAFLREQGFNALRLGINFGVIMPAPGVIDMDYVTAIATTAGMLAREDIYVLIDMHQAGYGPLFGGSGFPAWASLTDGLPNTLEPFPIYYFVNPALQRAFENFWDNREGPDGVPLQEHYATAFQVIAATVADEPRILGYELMNEPWPGADWEPCLTGCPDKEQARLVPFGERMVDAIRPIEPERLIFSEPWLPFLLGQTDTSLSGIGAPASALSFHFYASNFGLPPELDEAAIDRAIAASERGDAIFATEFGDTNDVATIHRLANALDTRLVPWLFWAWHRLIIDRTKPPTLDNIEVETVEALARPYASATNGTPESFAYDPDTGSFDYTWSTQRPSGEPATVNLPTTIVMPPFAYPDGYAVVVEGGVVLSEPCARPLLVGNDYGASTVRVQATRSGPCTP